MKTEILIENYIRQYGKIQKPLSSMAQELGFSSATVHRAIKSLAKKNIIKVVKPRLKTEADTIYYLGSPYELSPAIDELIEKAGEVTKLAEGLASQLIEKQRVINELQIELKKKRDMYS